MALPINNAPVYNITIPSTGKKAKFRPFLVKEEKALLLAQQSEDPSVMFDTLKAVIKDCCNGTVDVSSLALFDIEYLFTQIRAKSVGEDTEITVRCQHCDDEKAIVNVRIDLTSMEVEKDPKHSNNIPLFDNVGVVMKYPTFDLLHKIDDKESDISNIFDIVASCIDYIYDDTQVYHAKETDPKELETFLNNLTSEQLARIQLFFETMPKLTKQIEYNCPVCNADNNLKIEGLQNFF